MMERSVWWGGRKEGQKEEERSVWWGGGME